MTIPQKTDLENSFFDQPIFSNFDLQFHYITTCRRSDKACQQPSSHFDPCGQFTEIPCLFPRWETFCQVFQHSWGFHSDRLRSEKTNNSEISFTGRQQKIVKCCMPRWKKCYRPKPPRYRKKVPGDMIEYQQSVGLQHAQPQQIVEP